MVVYNKHDKQLKKNQYQLNLLQVYVCISDI